MRATCRHSCFFIACCLSRRRPRVRGPSRTPPHPKSSRRRLDAGQARCALYIAAAMTCRRLTIASRRLTAAAWTTPAAETAGRRPGPAATAPASTSSWRLRTTGGEDRAGRGGVHRARHGDQSSSRDGPDAREGHRAGRAVHPETDVSRIRPRKWSNDRFSIMTTTTCLSAAPRKRPKATGRLWRNRVRPPRKTSFCIPVQLFDHSGAAIRSRRCFLLGRGPRAEQDWI